LVRYRTANPSARLRRFREAGELWTNASERFEEREGLQEALKAVGFVHVKGDTVSHTVRGFTLEAFLEAQTNRHLSKLEIGEMTDATRDGFLRAVNGALSHLVHDGQLEILWPMFYLTASK
jgi:hypothetical protein